MNLTAWSLVAVLAAAGSAAAPGRTAALGTPAAPGSAPAAPTALPPPVVLVSADAEWKIVRALVKGVTPSVTPFGEWFTYPVGPSKEPVVFFHGGWGKIAAAGSTQYAIDRWKPRRLVNLGTCGGFKGVIQKGEVLLVDKT